MLGCFHAHRMVLQDALVPIHAHPCAGIEKRFPQKQQVSCWFTIMRLVKIFHGSMMML